MHVSHTHSIEKLQANTVLEQAANNPEEQSIGLPRLKI